MESQSLRRWSRARRGKSRFRFWLGVWTLAAAVGLPAQPAIASGNAAGSLVKTTMQSEVGVLLDEIPSSMRERVAAAMIAEPAQFWIDRAHAQLRLTGYQLTFRTYYYAAGVRQSLPLPPEPVWHVSLLGGPRRRSIDGHDVVAVSYQFSSVLVSDEASPAVSEPKLRAIGGQWHEQFMLPVDPELLLQRTGYACMDEDSFPFNSVDSEEVDSFYDQTAVVEKTLGNVGQSHYTVQPTQSCAAAVRDHVGKVETSVLFERLPWNIAVANTYRYGQDTGIEPDLATYLPDFLPSRTTYRYVHAADSGGCEVVEGSVDGTGWRRLLQFATSDENVGERDLTIGGVDYTISGSHGDNDLHNLFEFSPCHRHYHFKYYGQLGWTGDGPIVNAKNGFCMQDTLRTANREASPLYNRFSSCGFQGVSPGWADQYKGGLPNQWLDTTDLPVGTGTRSFRSNPNGFLCEGTFVDSNGKPIGPNDPVVWAPTGLTGENGKPVEAPLCHFKDGWDANDAHSVVESIQPRGEGLITGPCTRGQIGPLRNCGFGSTPTRAECIPGAATTALFALPPGAPPQVVRLTEFSHALGSPVPARYEDSYVPLRPGVGDQPSMLANAIVAPTSPQAVTFTCPSSRTGGEYEPGGTFSMYTAPVFPPDVTAPVTRL